VVEVALHVEDELIARCLGQCLLDCKCLVVQYVDIVGASEGNVPVLHVHCINAETIVPIFRMLILEGLELHRG
jgi:hypothetical protein